MRIASLSGLLGLLLLAACGRLAEAPEPNTSDQTTTQERERTVMTNDRPNQADRADDERAAEQQPQHDAPVKEAVFAGGCFWCVEAVFEQLQGVHEVISGYSGGEAHDANYPAVSAGLTNHAEAVKIIYDPSQISYEKLLEIHFATHDPTTLNRQGPDVGRHYRSAIFFADDAQKTAAEAFIARLADSGKYAEPIVTTLEPLTGFYPAEEYHQDYANRNPSNPYIRSIAQPKIDKVRTQFEHRVVPEE